MDYLLFTNAPRSCIHFCILALLNHAQSHTRATESGTEKDPPPALDICVKYWMKRYFGSIPKGPQPLKSNGDKRFHHFPSDPDLYHLDNYVTGGQTFKAAARPLHSHPQWAKVTEAKAVRASVIVQQGDSHDALCVLRQQTRTPIESHGLTHDMWKPRLWLKPCFLTLSTGSGQNYKG